MSDRFEQSLDAVAAAALAALISEISEECWCAGWLIDCEHSLWSMAQEPASDHQWGIGTVEAKDLVKLRALAIRCGGWVTWDEDYVGERWIAQAEWLPLHEAWKAELARWSDQ